MSPSLRVHPNEPARCPKKKVPLRKAICCRDLGKPGWSLTKHVGQHRDLSESTLPWRVFSTFTINGPLGHCPLSAFESISLHSLIGQTDFYTALIWSHFTGITKTRELRDQSATPATTPLQDHSRQASARVSSLSLTAPQPLFKLAVQMPSVVILGFVVFSAILLGFLQGWTVCPHCQISTCFPCCLQCMPENSALGIQEAEYWSTCVI